MTYSPVGAEDLAEHFCRTRASKGFQTLWGAGPFETLEFSRNEAPRVSLEVSLRDFFARKIPSFSGPESALNHAVTAPHTIVSITKRKAHPYG